jgi:hypothetical protein
MVKLNWAGAWNAGNIFFTTTSGLGGGQSQKKNLLTCLADFGTI